MLTTPVPARPARPVDADISATGSRGAVTSSHPAATDAGMTVLRAGGSAVDAYIATAAVQTVVEPTMTSLLGGMVVTVYDPTTGSSRLVLGIPRRAAAEDGVLDERARWSGRTVWVPAWVSAAHEAWSRWGSLPWADVFRPAARAAAEGVEIDHLLAGWMFAYRHVAGRTPAGRRAWFPDDRFLAAGDLLRQPELAETITRLGDEGPEFFFTGDFAAELVRVAQQAGGRITAADLAGVRSRVVDVPAVPVAGGLELHTSGPLYALLLNLARLAGLDRRGLPSEDPEVLRLMLRMVEEAWHVGLTSLPNAVHDPSASIDEMVAGVSPAAAERLLPQVVDGPPRPGVGLHMGTNGIVAVDESGMVAHGTHSMTSYAFGVGLMAGGVVVPRPSELNHRMPAGVGTSLLALRDGKPVYAAAAPSMSLVQNLFQNSVNVLVRGLNPADSVLQPLFGSPRQRDADPMVEAGMGADVIAAVEARGVPLQIVSPWELDMGACQAIAVENDGRRHAVADPRRLGRAAAY